MSDTAQQRVAIAFLLGLLIMLGYLLYCHFAGASKRRRRFEKRPIAPLEQWYAKYYPDLMEADRQHVEAIVQIFADEIGVHPSQLLPGDTVCDDYLLQGVCAFTDDSWDDLTARLTKYVRKVGGAEVTPSKRAPDSEWVTLDDLLRVMLASIRKTEKSEEPGQV